MTIALLLVLGGVPARIQRGGGSGHPLVAVFLALNAVVVAVALGEVFDAGGNALSAAVDSLTSGAGTSAASSGRRCSPSYSCSGLPGFETGV